MTRNAITPLLFNINKTVPVSLFFLILRISRCSVFVIFSFYFIFAYTRKKKQKIKFLYVYFLNFVFMFGWKIKFNGLSFATRDLFLLLSTYMNLNEKKNNNNNLVRYVFSFNVEILTIIRVDFL